AGEGEAPGEGESEGAPAPAAEGDAPEGATTEGEAAPDPASDPILYAAYDDDDGFIGFAPFAEGDIEYPPLSLEHPFLVITDNLGDFNIDMDSISFSGGGTVVTQTHTGTMTTATQHDEDTDWMLSVNTDGSNLIWRVHQDVFVGPAPVSISFDIYLDVDAMEFVYEHWYLSGEAESVRFYPNLDNPLYWRLNVQETGYSTNVDINWNNGTGLNSATFTDSEFGVVFTFPGAPNYPAGVSATSSSATWFPVTSALWLNSGPWGSAGQSAGPFLFHLEWTKGAGDRYFTIQGFPTVQMMMDQWGVSHDVAQEIFDGGVETTFQFYASTPGGNTSVGGWRMVTTEHWVPNPDYPYNPDMPLEWEADGSVRGRLNAGAQVLLLEDFEAYGSILIQKELHSFVEGFDFMQDWGVNERTIFHVAVIDHNTGEYLTFREVSPFVYEFTGRTANLTPDTTGILITQIQFSGENPARLNGIPTDHSYEVGDTLYRFSEILPAGIDLITTTFYVPDGEDKRPLAEHEPFFIEPDTTTDLLVRNSYAHGIGSLLIQKLFDGDLDRFEVDYDTVFYIRIWDIADENYLLFREMPYVSGARPFWCVGNHARGLTEEYDGDLIMEIPVSFNSPVILNNLWTWSGPGSGPENESGYEVREARRSSTAPSQTAMAVEWATERESWPNVPYFYSDPVEDGFWENDEDIRDFFTRWFSYWEPIQEIQGGDRTDFYLDLGWEWGVSFTGNRENVPFLETHVVNMTNVFKQESGQMEISKVLTGQYGDWGFTDDSIFYARVYNDALRNGAGDMLLFERMQVGLTGPVSWRYVGYYPAGGGEVVIPGVDDQTRYATNPGAFTTNIPFTQNNPADVFGLPTGAGNFYVVREYFPTPTFNQLRNSVVTVNGASFPTVMDEGEPVLDDEGNPVTHGVPASATQPLYVVIENDFTGAHGEAILIKSLEGLYGTWGLGNESVFYLQIFSPDYVLPEGATGTAFNFTYDPAGNLGSGSLVYTPGGTGTYNLYPLTFDLDIDTGWYVFNRDGLGAITHVPFGVGAGRGAVLHDVNQFARWASLE
ncbi:MAG: hypothetical protein FWG38_09865, partial [Defluviitaleaceae bacterium]|nr:hypothetical protein [Defluviitaleaceae bacterium]